MGKQLVATNIRITPLAMATADRLAPILAADLATSHLSSRGAVLREAVVLGLLELERRVARAGSLGAEEAEIGGRHDLR